MRANPQESNRMMTVNGAYVPNKAARCFGEEKRSATHFHRGHIPFSRRGARRSDLRVGRGTTTDWKTSARVKITMMLPSRSSMVCMLSISHQWLPKHRGECDEASARYHEYVRPSHSVPIPFLRSPCSPCPPLCVRL